MHYLLDCHKAVACKIEYRHNLLILFLLKTERMACQQLFAQYASRKHQYLKLPCVSIVMSGYVGIVLIGVSGHFPPVDVHTVRRRLKK